MDSQYHSKKINGEYSHIKNIIKVVIFIDKLKKISMKNNENILLGKINDNGPLFYISKNDLINHIGIFGLSGFGKTTTCMRVLEGLASNGYKILVFDWHGEYERFIKSIDGYSIKLGVDDYGINPLMVMINNDIGEHVGFLTDMFTEAFQLSMPQSYVLRKILLEIISKSNIQGLTINRIIEELSSKKGQYVSNYEIEIRMALLRRLEPLNYGVSKSIFNATKVLSANELLSSNISINFKNLSEEGLKRIVAYTIMRILYSHAVKYSLEKTVVVLEEARNIIPQRRYGDPPLLGEKMVSELRKHGVTMIIITQLPSQISYEIVRSLSLIILHRINSFEEILNVTGLQSILTETTEVTKKARTLNKGEALIFLPSENTYYKVSILKSNLMSNDINNEIIIS
ncbi:MAG: ATP-binding protein [Thermoprotei archaeon]|jgi:DNA helicase HerA-like ATPase